MIILILIHLFLYIIQITASPKAFHSVVYLSHSAIIIIRTYLYKYLVHTFSSCTVVNTSKIFIFSGHWYCTYALFLQTTSLLLHYRAHVYKYTPPHACRLPRKCQPDLLSRMNAYNTQSCISSPVIECISGHRRYALTQIAIFSRLYPCMHKPLEKTGYPQKTFMKTHAQNPCIHPDMLRTRFELHQPKEEDMHLLFVFVFNSR